MSRRAAREQETEDFLDANPQLIRYTTHIEVVEIEQEECEKEPINQIESFDIKLPYGASFMAQASIDGEPVPTFNGVVDSDDDMTLVDFVGFPSGEMYAGGGGLMTNVLLDEGPYYPFGDVLSLTEDGIGVAQSGNDMYNYPEMRTIEPILMEPSGNDAALDGDEMIFFDVRTFYKPDVQDFSLFEEEMEGHSPEFQMGGKELGIDFEVVSGTGTVQLVLIDYDCYGTDPVMVEMMAGGRAPSTRVDAGRIEGGMPDPYAFDGAYIAVTGDLEIVITGVDLSTNFNPFFGDIT